MTHASRVLDYLWSIAPDGASNAQIARAAGIASHQTVYMLTQHLVRRRLIRGEQVGRSWIFYAEEGPVALVPPSTALAAPLSHGVQGVPLSPYRFEALARAVLSDQFGLPLEPGSVPGVRKRFDFVSRDGKIVGDAKYFTLVGGVGLPPARFSVIAEHVWLLEKTGAPNQFLVFGNDRRVPERWLERHGPLAATVVFYYLSDDGRLELLKAATVS